MSRHVAWLVVLSSLILLPASSASADQPSLEQAGIGKAVAPFQLKDIHGQVYDSAQLKQPVVVVVFLGVDCPLAQLYASRLSELADTFDSKQVVVLGVNSNRHDTIAEMAAYARKYSAKFPLLKDVGNRVADQFDAQRTPEAFVLDAKREIRYRGRIDDQYGVGYSRAKPERSLLASAIKAVLAGGDVDPPVTRAVGCHIGRVANPDEQAEVTYANQVVRILNRHCVECHREGEIAPFALTDYDEVVGWAETMDEVIQQNRMPPWHADPKFGKFRNARRMTDEEKSLITQWVRAGAPKGDLSQAPKLPERPISGWRLPREPDVVVAMRERPFRVRADGIVEYQYFVVDPNFTKDKWVQAAEVIPGNRRVVHHAIVFIKPPDQKQMRGFGWLSAYVPGQAMLNLPDGVARKIPAGSKLIFQMHYTPAGAEQDDITKIGLVFADAKKVKEEAFSLLVMNREFEIPPNAANFAVDASLEDLPVGSRVLAIAPHMHVRGKSFRFAINEGGQSETLLSVPNYDFNWQHSYTFADPIMVTEKTRIECVATYDNSDANLVNPDPSAAVRWGDQTWQEMMLGYLELVAPVDRVLQDPAAEKRLAAARESADNFIRRFDRDKDGKVASRETPSAFSTFAFRRIDANGDKLITHEEAVRAALNNRNR